MSEIKSTSNVKKISKATIITICIISVVVIGVSFFFGLYVYYTNQNHDSAIIFEKAYDKIKDFDKQNVYTRQEMQGDIFKLLDNLLKNYSMTVSAKRALFYKAYVYFYVEKYDDALKIFQEFTKKFGNDILSEKSYYFISYCYEYTDKIDDAIKTLENFENKYKNSYYASMAYFRLGFLYEKKNDVKKAISYYKMIVDNKDETSQKEAAKKKLAILQNGIKL